VTNAIEMLALPLLLLAGVVWILDWAAYRSTCADVRQERDEAIAIARAALTELESMCCSTACRMDNWCYHTAPFRARLAQIGGKDG
jgi:hypothetical protein